MSETNHETHDIDAANLSVGDKFHLGGATLLIIGRAPPSEAPESAPDAPLYEGRIRQDSGAKRVVYGPHNLDAALDARAVYAANVDVEHTASPLWCEGCKVPCTGNELHSTLPGGETVCSYGCRQLVERRRRKERHN